MASISSTSTSTTSLSGTLRGYGGMASGIDRDSIIEAMTLGTTTKISNAKKEVTELEWRQEAFRSLTTKILGLQDNYMTFASSTSLKSESFFAANILTAVGPEDSTRYISATGSSAMLDYLSILGVKQTASSATMVSDAVQSQDIVTGINVSNLKDGTAVTTSNLSGTMLQFGRYGTEGQWISAATFTFPTSYTKEYEYTDNGDGTVTMTKLAEAETVTIDYTTDDPEKLEKQLNEYIWASKTTIGADKTIQFSYDGGKMGINYVNVDFDDWKDDETRQITMTDLADDFDKSSIKIRGTSSALDALGLEEVTDTDGNEDTVSFIGADSEYAQGLGSFDDAYVKKWTMLDYITGKSLTVAYGGDSASITLLTEEEKEKIEELYKDGVTDEANKAAMNEIKAAIQKRLDKAFGTDKVAADVDDEGNLVFKTSATGASQPLSINASSEEVRKNLDILENQSNKVSMSGTLEDNMDVLGLTADDFDANGNLKEFTINGVAIEGITKDTTVNELVSLINKNGDVGVKASYLSNTGQFVLVAEATGSNRAIDLGGSAIQIFGGADGEGTFTAGRDAVMAVSYGGVQTEVTSSTNTFNLDGMKITVSGTFGYDETGKLDSSQSVNFEAKADADKVTETVKKFVEEYNALIDELYSHVSTRPDRSYGALTEEQKDEMTEDEIEKWEKKAKQGLLFGDSSVSSLYSSLQTVFSKLMASGVSYSDLESIGITASDSKADYGKLIFDETKFKEAMNSDPEKVSRIFTGSTGLVQTIEDMLTPYATRYASRNGNVNGGSYGRFVEEAGAEEIATSLIDNFIFDQLKEMNEEIGRLQTRLKSEQDRYISQFTRMESMISQYNSQSSYIAGLSG